MNDDTPSDAIAPPASKDPGARALRAQIGATLFGQEAETIMIGRYEVLEAIGAGGMGSVYAAWDRSLERRVALKLLHADSPAPPRERERLFREAQALAKLSHPNVVQVYEVDDHDGTVFLVMELVEGVSLQAWQAQQARAWPEIVDIYLQAGQGLAAAHRAGLFHRDFKPANALVGRDGHVRVVDFGLAQGPGLTSASTSPRGPIREPSGPKRVTKTGALVGTPAYMSPEQVQRAELDARADQFSFCVSLFEALFGRRPYPIEALYAAQDNPPSLTIPAGHRIPRRITSIVRRGLSLERDHRWPSMEALLAALERSRSPRRGPWIIAALAAAGLASLAIPQAPDNPCVLPEDGPAARWTEDRRQAIRSAFDATSRPYAGNAWESVSTDIEAYIERWDEAYLATCEAHLRREPDRARYEVEVGCLERRVAQVAVVLDTLEQIDSSSIRRTDAILGTLDAIATCRARPPIERETEVRAQPSDLVRRIDRARALGAAGQPRVGLQQLDALLSSSADASASTRAEAFLARGELMRAIGDWPGAEQALLHAIRVMPHKGHEALIARAWHELVEIAVIELEDREKAQHWSELYAGVVEQAGDTELLRGEYLDARGLVASLEQDFSAAAAYHREALDLFERLGAKTSPAVITAMKRLANALAGDDQLEASSALIGAALDRSAERLGDQHPEVIASLEFNLGMNALGQQPPRFDAALASFDRAFRIEEQALGTDSPATARTATMLASVLLMRDDPADYPWIEQLATLAWQTQEKWRPLHHSDRHAALELLANFELYSKRYAQSLEHQFLLLDELPPGSEKLPLVNSNIGWLLCQLDRCREARLWTERARRAVPSGSPSDLVIQNTLGMVELAEGNPEAALDRFESILRDAVSLEVSDIESLLEEAKVNAQRARAVIFERGSTKKK